MRFGQQLSQQQKQVQKLAMTQELQQSIQILQFNTDELVSYLKDKTLENPLLDIKVTGAQADVTHYSRKPKKTSDDEESNFFAQIPDTQISLFEYLIDQIHLNYRDTYLRQLIIFLVEFIDVNGYLSIDLEDAAAKTGADFIQMLDALTLLQQLDPAGVGARNLQECLMLQTERDERAPELAYIVLEECFEPFADRKWKKIADKYEISLSEVQAIYDYVQTLSPNPGAGYGESFEQHIYPDIIVKRQHDELEVLSTRRGQPTIRFQEEYFNRMSQTDDPEVKKYLKEKKGEFNWLQKSVQQRGNTILRIGIEIVKRQREFFFDTSRPLKPMKLKELAETLDVHESTVSRAVNGKYLETDFGVFELRSFFTNAVNPDEGEDSMSASDVQQKIKKIIANENKNKPLSDQKILDLLKEEGIEISRRTVAKYRDVLGIPSSSNRKRYD
ncbi:RNA polymerase factor sigma-54 [Vagococcus elongatus]|uniref:RNA polymerase factor sigma-54 n=1 Tax=Vagococcus elongatus TaxID=180344 RepID=A0A430B620_9ENTE|nr:RNA polymerase factor sigma-54 [Vagococcus elongatus]RSU15737.1 RNA polymerase factor sigma-54 [Vagococcus elongatus]